MLKKNNVDTRLIIQSKGLKSVVATKTAKEKALEAELATKTEREKALETKIVKLEKNQKPIYSKTTKTAIIMLVIDFLVLVLLAVQSESLLTDIMNGENAAQVFGTGFVVGSLNALHASTYFVACINKTKKGNIENSIKVIGIITWLLLAVAKMYVPLYFLSIALAAGKLIMATLNLLHMELRALGLDI